MSAVESLGKYEIRRQLGRGAMGTVYEGFDPIIERIVAIKTVRLPEADDDETAEEIARFRREAQAAGRLTHPNIVGVFDYGETKDLAYIVMEYVDGPPLKNLLDKNERFPLPTIVRIMEDLLAGLQFSHDRGVVHRDIKPANLMMTKSGQAKIADFGIARIESSSMTQAGTVLGTPAYMSPEQFMGQVVDARSDIYSSGVLLYQLLTGERPFEGSMSAIMHKALNTEAPMPSQISVTAPRPFDAVVRKAMAKRPEDRFASASDFMAAIKAASVAPSLPMDEPDDSGEATMVVAPRPAAARSPEVTASALAAAIAPPSAATPRPVKAGGGRSVMPIIAGGGVAGLAVLGGLGYYLMTGRSSTPTTAPATPSTVSTAPVAPPRSPEPTPTAPVASGPVTPVQPATPPSPVVPPTTPQSPPAVPPVALNQPPVTPPPAADPNQVIRAEIGAFAANLSCSMFDGDMRDGEVQVTGIGGGAAVDGLRRKLTSMGLTRPSLRVTQVDTVFCPWEDTLRPFAKAFGETGARLSLRIAGDPAWLKNDDYIRPRITMSDFRGGIRVDYLDRQGNVQHLYPQVADPAQKISADPARVFEPGDVLSLGDPGPGVPGWQVAEPFGTDVIIAIESEDELFERPRPSNVEKAAVYLRDLKRALESAKSRGAKITATALPLETRLK